MPGIDFSASAIVVVPSPVDALMPAAPAARLAEDERGVCFVHIDPPGGDPGPGITRSSALIPLHAQIAAHFTSPAERLVIRRHALRGPIPGQLAAVAKEYGSDLMLFGDTGWPRRQGAHLAMEAPCSVWLVPPGWAPVLRRLLVPIDFSRRSATTLRMAVDLASSFPPAKCLAMHVYHSDSRFHDESTDRRYRRELSRQFDDFVAGLDPRGVAVEPLFVASHQFGRAVARAAEQYRADLVVMATRGRSRMTRLMLPSAAESAIQHCRGPLLVVKRPGTTVSILQAARECLRRTSDPLYS
jgi:nucleotide-binding universal stress UspA family protein